MFWLFYYYYYYFYYGFIDYSLFIWQRSLQVIMLLKLL